jgi:transcriptional regulator with XRE-family HTH domain
MMATVGDRIRLVRESKGLTQDQLATAAGISKSFISEVENGKRNVSAQNLLRIANALGASIEYLMRGVSAAPQQEAAAVTVPPELATAAERLGLSFSETLDLLQTQRSVVARRSGAVSKDLTVEHWIDLHKTIKRVFG